MADSPRAVHYIHRMSYSRQERLVGAFVLIALCVIVVLMLVNSKTVHFFERSVTFHAYLRSAEGITTETPVKISGLEVGRISDITIAPDNRIHIAFKVNERYRDLVRSDSQAAIGKLSVLGKSTFEITAGSVKAKVLESGATLPVEEPMSMDQIIAELTPVVKGVKTTLERINDIAQGIDPKQVHQTVANLQQTASNMRKITDQVANGKSIAALERTLNEASARLAELEPIIKDAKGITGNTQRITGELPMLVSETTQLASQLKVTATTFNTQLQEVPDLVSRMKVLMDQTERTMDTLNHTWPLSSGTPPPAPVVLEVQQIR